MPCSTHALNGLPNGPKIALQAEEALMARASTGDDTARADAERLLSTAWVLYARPFNGRHQA